jgi:hypothetical protein
MMRQYIAPTRLNEKLIFAGYLAAAKKRSRRRMTGGARVFEPFARSTYFAGPTVGVGYFPGGLFSDLETR